MKKEYGLWIKLALTTIILLVLFLKVGVSEIVSQLKNLNFFFLIPLLIFNALTIILTAFSIFLLVRKVRKSMKFLVVLKKYITVWSLNLFIPGRLGDLSMIYLLKKEGVKAGASAAIMLIDNLITIFVVAVFSLIGVYTFFGVKNTFLTILGLVVLLFIIKFFLSKKQRTFMGKKLLGKRMQYFKGFSKTLQVFVKKNKLLLMINLLITIVKTLFAYAAFYIGFKMVYASVSYVNVLRVVPIARLISFLPITINGIGVREGIAVYLFNLLGVAGSTVLAASIVLMIITYVTGILAIALGSISSEKKG